MAFWLAAAFSALAEDWPCWRGGRWTGISAELGWLDRWPPQGPPTSWKASVGVGLSSVAVWKGRLYTMGHENGSDSVVCLDAASGEKLWAWRYEADAGARDFEGGPTATPAVDSGKVFTLSRWGDALCLDAADGRKIWSVNLRTDLGFRVPTWGFAGSPRVVRGVVLLNAGESGVALDASSGKRVWASADGDPGYSTPLPFERSGEWFAFFSSGEAYTAMSISTGRELWRIPWVTRYGVNAADPIFLGNRIFLSSGYAKGAALVEPTDAGVKTVWKNRLLRNQFHSSVLLEGHLFGVDGDAAGRTALKCIRLETGEERWSFPGTGSGGLMAADGRLIVLAERGELLIGPASCDSFAPSARAQILSGKCWTPPVLSNGRIYCRSAGGDLVAVDVRLK